MDQQTGEDLNPNRRRNLDLGPADEVMRNPDRPIDPSLLEVEENPMERKRLAKITDLEKWEIKQVFPLFLSSVMTMYAVGPSHHSTEWTRACVH